MIRNLKALGLALVATMALGAVAASAASAQPTFSAEGEHAILDVVSNETQTFNIPGAGTVNCEKVSVEATILSAEESTSELKATPTYSECEAFSIEAHIDFTGCWYLFTANGEVHILCPPGSTIDIKVTLFGSKFNCVMVEEQSVNEVAYSNKEGHVNLEPNVSGIKSTVEGVCGNETNNEGTYKGNVTVAGTDTEEEPINIFWTE